MVFGGFGRSRLTSRALPHVTNIHHVHVHRFLTHQRVARGFSERTIARRAWTLGLWVDHVGGDLTAATADDVEAFLGNYPGAQTRYSMRSDINQLYRFLERRGIAEHNPAALVEAPRLPRRAASPVTTVGATRLAVMLAAYAGLRVSEIAALRGEDIDLANGMLMVRNGKGGKDDPVPLAPALADELALWPRSGHLFTARSGAAIAARIRAAYRRLGIMARPHDLRHSFGTEAARTSGDLRAVQRLMRHRSIATTERYVDYWPSGGDIVASMYGGDAA
jgi:integrase/recombinase XerD